MVTIILLVVILILLTIVLLLMNKFKRTFKRYKGIDEMIETERLERLKTLQRQTEKQEQKLQEERDTERERLRIMMEGRRADLDEGFEMQRMKLETEFAKLQKEVENKRDTLTEDFEEQVERIQHDKTLIQSTLDELKHRQEKTIMAMKEQEKDKNELDFHRIMFSEDEHNDIKFLLEVEKKLYNKDVLRKLIYKTYIEKSMNEMFARVVIETTPGIYKIENIDNKKVYIGQSTNVRNRLREHLKSAVGISSIANQAIHDAMAAEGIENFTFHLVDDECTRESLNEREKYWIDFYKANEWGYNRTRGGS